MKNGINSKNTLLASFLLITMIGCSTMPATNTGFLAEDVPALNAGSKKIAVSWRIADDKSITPKEKRLLTDKLISALESELSVVQLNTDLSTIRIRAAVTRVETVSVPLNWLSTILVFAPLDRGGVAVEFEAIDITDQQTVAQLNFARWTPITDFLARFNRITPAELGMTSAASTFVTKLQKSLPAS